MCEWKYKPEFFLIRQYKFNITCRFFSSVKSSVIAKIISIANWISFLPKWDVSETRCFGSLFYIPMMLGYSIFMYHDKGVLNINILHLKIFPGLRIHEKIGIVYIRKFHIVRDKDPKKKLYYIQYLHVKCIGIMSMSEVCKYKPTSF